MSVLPLDGCLLPYPASSHCRWLVFLAAGCTVVNSRGGSCCLHVDKYDGATGRSMFFPIVFGHLHYACRLLPQASCNLLSASRLLRWLCAFCDAGVWV